VVLLQLENLISQQLDIPFQIRHLQLSGL
jgi:hypothetical protein